MLHILIVDSNHENCEDIEKAFNEFGFEMSIYCLHSLKDLMSFFDKKIENKKSPPIDLVLLDDEGKNQSECLKFLRTSGVIKNTKIVLLTDSENIETFKEAIKNGAEYVIKKPFSIYSFIDYIRKTNYFALTVVKIKNGT